jgi:quinol monooxygenase YgiN
MLVRLVKMTFREAEIENFKAIFSRSRAHIRAFPGCHHLELWQDQNQPHVFFTHSHWEDIDALEAYRRSPLFQETWQQTKPLFAEPAQAWSLRSFESV